MIIELISIITFKSRTFKRWIERFHNKIQAILQDELEAAKVRLKEELIPLNHSVKKLQSMVEEIQPSMAFSKEFLDAYTRIDRTIHKLEDENEAFDTRNTLQNEKNEQVTGLKHSYRRF